MSLVAIIKKEGGEYYADAYSRHLRKETGRTEVDTRKIKK